MDKASGEASLRQRSKKLIEDVLPAKVVHRCDTLLTNW